MSEKQEFIEFKGLKIDPIIFKQGFVPGCEMEKCSGQCCNWGVYMDKDFYNVIMNYEQRIKDIMDEHQTKDSKEWFEEELEKDSDFPSGYAIGTELYINSKGTTQCVFKDKNSYCSLQVVAMKNNLHKWAVKPKYCILYPLTIVNNVLTYDNDHSAKLDYCGIGHEENFTQTVFEATKEEIKFVLGDEVFNFLDDHFKKNYQRKYQIEIVKRD